MIPQAGLFSAILTAFIIDSKQDLKVSPADQMVYYLQQNVAILDQISHQISSIAPQVSIPSTPPLPFPSFNPLASDLRVNAFWFMALVFSLSTALLATLVQQWVREYMHVFQRYSDPLKSARLRQYLHEGSEGWYMPVVAEAVPGLLHVSLFLFLLGLCDFVLNINTTVGLGTTIPIGITGILYIFTIFAPIIYPQSPYQNSFSGLIWYLMQKLGGRQYKDRSSDGALKPVSWNMAQGKLQLAMEETEDRKGRDERAIRWLVDNMTEDAEMESFVMAIPGSFNGKWGTDVWKKVSNTIEVKNKNRDGNQLSCVRNVFGTVTSLVGIRTAGDSRVNTTILPPAPHPTHIHWHSTGHVQGEDTVRELSARVAHVLETCKNRRLFASDELWQRRTRACIETTASLVCCAEAELAQFGDIAKVLGDVSSDPKVRESLVAKDQSFAVRYTCLSLVAIRPILESNGPRVSVPRAWVELISKSSDYVPSDEPMKSIPSVVQIFDNALRCLHELSRALPAETNPTEEEVKEILRKHEPQISELEQIDVQSENIQSIDEEMKLVQDGIDECTHGIITRQFPGVEFDDLDTESIHFGHFVQLFRHRCKHLLLFPLQNLKRIQSLASTFRDILKGQWDADTFEETCKSLQPFSDSELPSWRDNPCHRLVWRLRDLNHGGGLGFTVELFFLALRQLLSTSPSIESHSALYIGTFRAITSDWSKYKSSVGTQQLLLDMVVPHRGILLKFDYPTYITHEFLSLLGNILEGQEGDHIADVVNEVSRDIPILDRHKRAFLDKALGVIARARASSS